MGITNFYLDEAHAFLEGRLPDQTHDSVLAKVVILGIVSRLSRGSLEVGSLFFIIRSS